MAISTIIRQKDVRTRIWQVSDAEKTMRLPKGRKDTRTHLVNVTAQYRARQDPCQTQFRISKQRRFINYDYTQLEQVMEVYRPKMKIPEAILQPRRGSGKTFLKAVTMGCKLGEHVSFTITGDVNVTQERTDKNGKVIPSLYSVPVETSYNDKKLEGEYNLNMTAVRALAQVLGDESKNWVGAKFTAFVQQQRNPQTNTYGPSFTVLDGSVKSAKTR